MMTVRMNGPCGCERLVQLKRTVPRDVFGKRQPIGRATSAPHLRGKVYKQGDTWCMDVVNLHTGRIIACDNTGHWGPMYDLADETVGAARRAWLQGFGKKDLKVKKSTPQAG